MCQFLVVTLYYHSKHWVVMHWYDIKIDKFCCLFVQAHVFKIGLHQISVNQRCILVFKDAKLYLLQIGTCFDIKKYVLFIGLSLIHCGIPNIMHCVIPLLFIVILFLYLLKAVMIAAIV